TTSSPEEQSLMNERCACDEPPFPTVPVIGFDATTSPERRSPCSPAWMVVVRSAEPLPVTDHPHVPLQSSNSSVQRISGEVHGQPGSKAAAISIAAAACERSRGWGPGDPLKR